MPLDPVQLAVLEQLGATYAPLTAGIQHQFPSAMEGSPLAGFGMPGLIGQMLLQGALGSQFQQRGFAPFTFGTGENAFDRMERFKFERMLQTSAERTAYQDAVGHMETFRGIAAMTGTPWGGAQQAAARSLASGIQTISPMLAIMAPETLDALSGVRGSSVVMSRSLGMGGRYRRDPVTGRMGLSEESLSSMSSTLFDEMYAGDNYLRQRGMSAGRAGQLFDVLSRMGLTGSVAGPEAPAGGLDKLSDTGLRQFDSQRVKATLESYQKVVTAMRDIFGDLGEPNAPMPKLIATLQGLTSNGMGRMSAEELANTARMTYGVAKTTGLGLPGAAVLMNQAGVMGGRFGLSPLFNAPLAQQGMLTGGAFDIGRNTLPAFGAMTKDEAMQASIHAHAAAAASFNARSLAVIARANELGMVAPGSEAAAVYDAIKAGNPTYQWNGQTQLAKFLEPGAMALLGRSAKPGVDMRVMAGTFWGSSNQETILKYNLQNLVQPMQVADMGKLMDRAIGSFFRSKTVQEQLGITPGQAAQITADAVAGLTNAPTGSHTNEGINAIISGAIRKFSGAGGVQVGASADAARQQLEQSFKRFTGGELAGWLQLNNRDVQDARRRDLRQVQLDNMEREGLAGLGQDMFLRRAVEAFRKTDFGNENALQDWLMEAFGGAVKLKDIDAGTQAAISFEGKRFTKALQEVRSAAAAVQKSKPGSPEEKAARARHAQALQQLRHEEGAVREFGDRHRQNFRTIETEALRRDAASLASDVAGKTTQVGERLRAAKTPEAREEIFRSGMFKELSRDFRDLFAAEREVIVNVAGDEALGGVLTDADRIKITEFNKNQEILESLAKTHAGGDMARLFTDPTIDKNVQQYAGYLRKQAVGGRDDLAKRFGDLKRPDLSKMTPEQKKLHTAEFEKTQKALGTKQEDQIKVLAKALGVSEDEYNKLSDKDKASLRGTLFEYQRHTGISGSSLASIYGDLGKIAKDRGMKTSDILFAHDMGELKGETPEERRTIMAAQAAGVGAFRGKMKDSEDIKRSLMAATAEAGEREKESKAKPANISIQISSARFEVKDGKIVITGDGQARGGAR